MTTPNAERDSQASYRPAPAGRAPQPAFKPVALPALAAAVRAAGQRIERPRTNALPAILRKEAMTD
ncbi:hypothetical protein [Microvirga thermotolerans]|uniref:Uncharacterized protein n=1 Tax=Microvirga thermotolerans TaxID=2651334 RepID=A0A5P9JSV4_9HYPH|nr:hypothetical protein [Microvirga thermotolerans]QFU15892.1 hypothetical protein GDR74_06460 [Microvirga thermotolerans]